MKDKDKTKEVGGSKGWRWVWLLGGEGVVGEMQTTELNNNEVIKKR